MKLMKRPAIDAIQWRLETKDDFDVCELSVLDIRLLLKYIKYLEDTLDATW